eukprot:TRINITY_DN10785_c0_g1_i1.p1 TRINITY_DN10785_c0_g1~~TRINITY_DN10785_c0_g1_i1.p1  ORF type:complete len:690 (-),score=270.00 TRINITY_DN10785_c0_g1_i1:179-2248(-)
MKIPVGMFVTAGSAMLTSGATVHENAQGMGKVVEMLTDLSKKIEKDGEAETAAFAKYSSWCAKSQQEKGFEIKDAEEDIATNQAKMEKARAASSAGASKIEDLQASVAQNGDELAQAQKVRTDEQTANKKAETELVETIEVVGKAVKALQTKNVALLQEKGLAGGTATLLTAMKLVVDSGALPSSDSDRLMALAQTSSDAADDMATFGSQAPEADAYNKKSGSVLDMLQELKDKAEVELADLRKKEVTAQNNFELLSVSLKNEIKTDSDDLASSKAKKAEADQTKAAATTDLTKAQSDLKAAQTNLQDIKTNCETVATDAEASKASREEELKAIAAAKEALTESSLIQEAGHSFLQVEKSVVQTPADLHNLEVVSLLRASSRKNHAPALAQLAEGLKNVLVSRGPLDQVTKMLEDMIVQMEEKQKEDTRHLEYCKKETAASTDKLSQMDAKMEGLAAKKDKAETESAALKKEVEAAEKELAELKESQAEADKIRGEEKKDFEAALADVKEGLQGARTALQVLRDYYSKTGASFIQTKQVSGQPEMPDFHSKSETGAGGIIPMLETVEEDLAKNLATSKQEEKAAVQAYEKLTLENQEAEIRLSQDVKYKTKEAASLDKAALALVEDIESATTEQEAAAEYAKQINEACVPKPEAAAAERAQQIEDLKQALEMLGSGAGFLQRKAVSLHF